MNKRLLFIIGSVSLVILWVLFVFLVYRGVNKTNVKPIGSPTPTPFSKNLNIEYSKLNLVKPGTSTLEDVEKINGLPSSISTIGNKTYLYYDTPVKLFKNKVLIMNNVVVYYVDNVFSYYKGTYDQYVNSYGNPDFVLYENNPYAFPWYVFLKRGLAIQSNNNIITAILAFAPTNEASFMKKIAGDLGLSKRQPSPEGELNPAP